MTAKTKAMEMKAKVRVGCRYIGLRSRSKVGFAVKLTLALTLSLP